MRLIVTIDTEEDAWLPAYGGKPEVHNIGRIPALQEVFDSFSVIPTYLVTYPVAADNSAVSILRAIRDSGRCEIGAHCHPWTTPPHDEEPIDSNSMLCNLPFDLQQKKLRTLHECISENFGREPTSFRAGRWAFNEDIRNILCLLGYSVDTSISPYMDWSNSYGPDFAELSPMPFRYACEGTIEQSPKASLAEIPASVGFLQKNFDRTNRLLKNLRSNPLRRLRLVGICYRLHLVNRVWLSPEVSDTRLMMKLLRSLRERGYPFANLTFHSSSLLAGLTPFVRTIEHEQRFLNRIRDVLAFALEAGIHPIRLSEAAETV